MAETRIRFEGEQNDIIDDRTAYELLLNQMFTADKNLQLKTEFINPIEFARFYFIIDMIRNEADGELLKDEAEMLSSLGLNIMKNYISKDRKGRKEAFDSIKSYNMGNVDNKDDIEAEKFKRLIKNMK